MTIRERFSLRSMFFQLVILAGLIAAASAIGYGFRHLGFPETNIVTVYLLAVLIASCCSVGYLLGILASVVATLAYNYFFTAPFYSLSVYDPSYFITFFIMTVTAIIACTMTARVKQSALETKAREAETKSLYGLMNHLTGATDYEDISRIAIRYISQSLSCQAACLCYDENGLPERTFLQQAAPDRQVRRQSGDLLEIQNRFLNCDRAFDAGAEFWDWPVRGQSGILAIMRIPAPRAAQMKESQINLLQSMVESIALAMDRFLSVRKQAQAHEETVQERYRADLLRSISHDLRTPLAGIMGTSEMMIDMSRPGEPLHDMAESIRKEANWLYALVINILNLTKLQDGKLTIRKEPEAVEEIVGGAVSRISKQNPDREIQVQVPQTLLMVPMDGALVEQVLVNLLDNACKHTPLQNEISVSVREDTDSRFAVFTVSDTGEGILKQDLDVIFQAFYTSRGKRKDSQRGIGLGLTICQAIVLAHGGSITAAARTDGPGTEMIFTLPMEDTPYDSDKPDGTRR